MDQIQHFSQHSQSSCLYRSSEEEEPKLKHITLATPGCTQVAEMELYGSRTVSKRKAFILSDSDSEVTQVDVPKTAML